MAQPLMSVDTSAEADYGSLGDVEAGSCYDVGRSLLTASHMSRVRGACPSTLLVCNALY